ncbi:MAG: UvrD-helicase domain-containing protein, partial [Firmicutes bacterium]|nr:UvrD-helicase domain-containing protein [Bacillota bacterium]
MNWTAEQERAITLRNKNILVAAAAGSGKTAVLVERIKRLLLEDRCPIDRMLIVTFTNAAASEMKEKIQKAIGQAIRQTESREDLVFLKKQLDLLPAAQISTFHAFALEVIRRYFYIIDIEPNFRICDGTQQTILRSQAMDQLLEERFEEGKEEFYQFLNKFSGDRNNDKIRQMIEKAFDTIQSLPEPYQWLDERAEMVRGDFETFMDSPVMKYVFCELKEKIEEAIEDLEENRRWAAAHKMDGFLELAEADLVVAKNLAEIIMGDYPDFEKIRQELENCKLANITKKYADPE